MERSSAGGKNVLVLLPLNDAQKHKIQAAGPSYIYEFTHGAKAADGQIGRAHIIVGNIPPAQLMLAENLEWFQSNSVGVESYLKRELYRHDILLTNAAGAYGLAISEYLLAVLLSLMKRLHLYRDQQSLGQWQSAGGVTSIYGSTVLVVGLGDIGREFARKVKALGATVIGVKRTPGDKPSYIDELHTLGNLDLLIGKADAVALCLPNTPATKGVLSRERIFSMKKGAILLNVGRGQAVDTDALCDALQSGHLGGAGLDVTDPEPLPAGHILWSLKNALITPHVSGGYSLPNILERVVDIAAGNLERYSKGEPLVNLVDFDAGY